MVQFEWPSVRKPCVSFTFGEFPFSIFSPCSSVTGVTAFRVTVGYSDTFVYPRGCHCIRRPLYLLSCPPTQPLVAPKSFPQKVVRYAVPHRIPPLRGSQVTSANSCPILHPNRPLGGTQVFPAKNVLSHVPSHP